ncbi:LiaF domain-containing protein [Corynebacterium sp. HMSC072A04]|uniref:LiaF domain-containing protein n=1 Tax=Corynebacterium sp. HMSC072A04 TaxID=1715045 RepID=UPI001FEDB339|nr:LiaF domain-containing protein [Corynebacterium sp. HMSC072A04]
MRGIPIAAHHTTMGIFGGTDVDLRGASLKEHVTTIQAVGVFGGVDVWVPEGFRVRVNGVGLFGGHDIKVEGGAIDPADLPASAPEVVVNCFSLFGGVDVHVVKR